MTCLPSRLRRLRARFGKDSFPVLDPRDAKQRELGPGTWLSTAWSRGEQLLFRSWSPFNRCARAINHGLTWKHSHRRRSAFPRGLQRAHRARQVLGRRRCAPDRAREWLAYVQKDPELTLSSDDGPYFAKWNGQSEHPDPWLDWSNGNIYAKNPKKAWIDQMIAIARDLQAKVQGGDDEIHVSGRETR